MNYKSLQKPDKKGKPNFIHSKATIEELGAEGDSDVIELIKGDSLEARQVPLSIKVSKNPIRANNVSRPPNQDVNIMELAKKISDIKAKNNLAHSDMDEISLFNNPKNTKSPNTKDNKYKAPNSKTDIPKVIPTRQNVEVERKVETREQVIMTKTKVVVSTKEKTVVKSFNNIK